MARRARANSRYCGGSEAEFPTHHNREFFSLLMGIEARIFGLIREVRWPARRSQRRAQKISQGLGDGPNISSYGFSSRNMMGTQNVIGSRYCSLSLYHSRNSSSAST